MPAHFTDGHLMGRAFSCNCIGPQPGMPRCPCAMRGLIQRDGRWIQPEADLGPVIPDPAKPADGWTGPGEKPHRYSPDPMLMGDCRICGHTQKAHENVAFAPPAPREGGEG